MKNMKMKFKLLLSFGIVIVLTLVMGLVSIISTGNLDTSYSNALSTELEEIGYIGNASVAMANQRSAMRGIMLQMEMGNNFDSLLKEVEDNRADFDQHLKGIQSVMQAGETETKRHLDEVTGNYAKFTTEQNNFLNAVSAGDKDKAMSVLSNASGEMNTVQKTFDELLTYLIQTARDLNVQCTNQYYLTMGFQVGLLVVAVVVSLILAFYVASIISKPLIQMQSVLSQMSETGDMDFTPEQIRAVEAETRYKDEIGTSMKGFHRMMTHFIEISRELGVMAEGDMTHTVATLSAQDTMGNAMNHLIDSINSMFGEINASSDQVSVGAKQIADGAQMLAQGSTEQAASVQELSSSINEVADKTQANAKLAQRAAELSESIRANAEKGSHQMDQMMEAVREINDASESISKVIKVIDDIAFQTNILALNAAVEAARAGEYGKGFAVVAEEVRSLAAKSAEAAKDTTGLIDNSISKAQFGARIAGETAASLGDIVSGVNDNTVIVGDIAQSSDEQSAAIKQINIGIEQVAQVVQQNSATAEQSAAASEEMNGQADMLTQLVAQFKLKETGGGRPAMTVSPGTAPPETEGIADGAFLGKY